MTADEVKKARAMMGVAQRDLALKLGVSVALVGHWETGRAKITDAHAVKLRRMAIDGAMAEIKAKRPNAGVGGYPAKPESRPVAASKPVEQGLGSVERWPGFHSERGGAFDEYLWRTFP